MTARSKKAECPTCNDTGLVGRYASQWNDPQACAAYAPDPLAYLAMHRNAILRNKHEPHGAELVAMQRRLERRYRQEAGRTPLGFAAMAMCERAIRCDLTMRQLLGRAA